MNVIGKSGKYNGRVVVVVVEFAVEAKQHFLCEPVSAAAAAASFTIKSIRLTISPLFRRAKAKPASRSVQFPSPIFKLYFFAAAAAAATPST